MEAGFLLDRAVNCETWIFERLQPRRGRKAEKTICLRRKREQSVVKFGFDQKAAIVASPHRPFPKQAPEAGSGMKSFLLYGPAGAGHL